MQYILSQEELDELSEKNEVKELTSSLDLLRRGTYRVVTSPDMGNPYGEQRFQLTIGITQLTEEERAFIERSIK